MNNAQMFQLMPLANVHTAQREYCKTVCVPKEQRCFMAMGVLYEISQSAEPNEYLVVITMHLTLWQSLSPLWSS